jgi:hypothetical protein
MRTLAFLAFAVVALTSCQTLPENHTPWRYIALGGSTPAFDLQRAQLSWACDSSSGVAHFSPSVFSVDSSWHALNAGDSIEVSLRELPPVLRALTGDCGSMRLSIAHCPLPTWRASFDAETLWLAAEIQLAAPGLELANEIEKKGWGSDGARGLSSPTRGDSLALEMQVFWPDGAPITSSPLRFEFLWGHEKQVLPCVEGWLRAGGVSGRIWSTSTMAFGRLGLPAGGLPPDTPVLLLVKRLPGFSRTAGSVKL